MDIARKSKFFKINGKSITSCQSCTVQFESLAGPNSGRTDDGVMHIDWIWQIIRKVNIKLPPMSQNEIERIMALVQGQEYDLTYLDPIKGIHTIHCYTSNSSAECKSGILYGGLWLGAAFNAIELAGE